jgi:CheY-like chemotaxis protein
MSITEYLAPYLPYLRRYGRALTGSQASGDAYVRATLAALINRKAEMSQELPSRVALYHIFHTIWSSSAITEPFAAKWENFGPDQRIQALTLNDRAALLLTAVEGFSIKDTSRILNQTPEEVGNAIIAAQRAIEKQMVSRVLIIEDEAVIALDLANLVRDLGHRLVGTAATKNDAVAKARSEKPELILADINLGEGGSGIDAVSEILHNFDIPVIFITAYPERLLTGERPEPTYLITKPFLPETVQATIGQALFFHIVSKQAAA